MKDDRPWLGALVRPLNSSSGSPVVVQRIVSGSPADGRLQPGDVIVAVNGKAPPSQTNTLGPALIDQIEKLHAGSNVTLDVERGASLTQVTIHLGSVMDESAQGAVAPSNTSILF